MFRRLGIFGLALGGLVLALPAAAGTLSPRLAQFSAAWRQAPQATISRALSLSVAAGPRSLAPRVHSDGTVQVYLHYRAGTPPGREALAALGAHAIVVSPALDIVQAWVPVAKLEQAAALGGVTKVDLPVYAWVKGQPYAPPATGTCAPLPVGLTIDTEGIYAENAAAVQAQGIEGAGVKVGIISNGADCVSSSQTAGYLPSNIYIPAELAGSGAEGTAMMEEVYAMAPEATLGFCGPATTVDFMTCLEDFASWGATVISDDLGFFPVGYNFDAFQAPDGGDAITEFAQANPDVTLTTSAGNDQQDYFESDYVGNTDPTSPSGVPITLSPTYTPDPIGGVGGRKNYPAAMDFGASLGEPTDSAMQVVIAPGINLFANLTWDDPASGPYDDLDLFLIKQNGQVACSPNQDQWCNSTLDQLDNPAPSNPNWIPPFEIIDYTNNTSSNQTLYLVALCYDCGAHGSQPLHLKLYGFMNGGGIFNYITNGGVSGHGALDAELTTAAARWNGGPTSGLDYYSDTGPFAYGDWLNGTHSLAKPDITGTDGVAVSGAGGFPSPFYGTSAASPNVGSVIALLRSYAPVAETGAAGWKALVMNTANPDALSNYTPAAGGAGLTDAAAALSSLGGTVIATITAPSGSPVKVNPNTGVNFTATCTGGLPPYRYLWTFGGNSGIPQSPDLTPAPVQYANGGIYTVKFTCSDSASASSLAQLTVAVQAAATAENLSVTTDQGQPVTGQLEGSRIGGEQIVYESVTGPKHGLLTDESTDGSFTYAPDAGFSGKDTFTFAIYNGVKTSNAATVSITVKAPPSSGGGGGAFGGLGLAVLAGVFAIFRRRH